jgi:hypothetical protein
MAERASVVAFVHPKRTDNAGQRSLGLANITFRCLRERNHRAKEGVERSSAGGSVHSGRGSRHALDIDQ